MYQGYQEKLKAATAQAQQAGVSADARAANPALWFERMCELDATAKPEDGGPKTVWLRQLLQAGKQVGDATLLAQQLATRSAFAQTWGNSAQLSFWRTSGPLVTGCGNPHPLENGFCWHPQLCVPYLPASAVKGVLRAYLQHWLGWEKGEIENWFGAAGGDNGAAAGKLVFFDLLPVAPVHVKADVMTPHLGEWITEGGKVENPSQAQAALPGPWHNPVPIPFLVVQEARFSLLLAQRDGGHDLLDDAVDKLGQALQLLGVGAKTASGYGRLEVDAEHIAENARRAELARIERERLARLEQEAAQRAARLAAQEAQKSASSTEKFALLLKIMQGKQEKDLAKYLAREVEGRLRELDLNIAEFSAMLWAEPKLKQQLLKWQGQSKGDGPEVLRKFPKPGKKGA